MKVLELRRDKCRWVDRIVVLENGVVREEGTHDALLERGGKYAAMWARQAAEEEEQAA